MGSRSSKARRTICVHSGCCNGCQQKKFVNNFEDNASSCNCMSDASCSIQQNYMNVKSKQPFSQKVSSYNTEDEPSSFSLLSYIDSQSSLQQPPPPSLPQKSQSIRRRSSSLTSRSSFQQQQQQPLQQNQQQQQSYYQMPAYLQKSFKSLPTPKEPEQEMPNILQQVFTNNSQEQRSESPVPVPVAFPSSISTFNLQQIASILKYYQQAKEQKIVIHPLNPVSTQKYLQKPINQKDNLSTLIEHLRAFQELSSKSTFGNTKPYKSVVSVM